MPIKFYLQIERKDGFLIKELKPFISKEGKIFSQDEKIFVPIDSDEKEVLDRLKKINKNLENIKIVEPSKVDAIKKQNTNERGNLKEILSNQFSESEIDKIKASYDIVGDIAIIEIDDEFLDKKDVIGEAILKANPHVKTVLMKKGKHEGVFRIQKYDFVKGIDKRETIHKENGVLLKLKVDEAYFSVRMGNERKRIVDQIKENEDVLVMFSGVGPYPIEIAKNSKVRVVYGVELNPNGHKYSYENKFLNKAWNFLPIQGDAKKVAQSFYSYSFGLKSSINPKELNKKINNEVNKGFAVIELALFHEDLLDNKDNPHNINQLIKTIDYLKSLGKNVFLHMPMPFKLEPFDEYLKELRALGKIAKEKQCLIIVHLPSKEVIRKSEQLQIVMKKYKDFFYYENLTQDNLLTNYNDFSGFKDLIKNVCVDISHLGLVFKDQNKVKEQIKLFNESFNTYFHLNNYSNNEDSVELDKGELDIKELLDDLTFGVVEVRNKDEFSPKEMINSFRWLSQQNKSFDRILMPLPKGAENFLDDALGLIKDNGIIHFYDFLHEKDFDKAIEKIDNACKNRGFNFEVIDFVKCGQHSPRTYRICVDFKVIKKK